MSPTQVHAAWLNETPVAGRTAETLCHHPMKAAETGQMSARAATAAAALQLHARGEHGDAQLACQ